MSELPGKVRSSAPLNLRQIEVFHAIMITGSLSAAGRLLHVTQPAISRVLASIELRLGYALFERFKGRLHPTKEARKLFQEVESIQAGVNRLNDMAAGLAGHGGGHQDRVDHEGGLGAFVVAVAGGQAAVGGGAA